MATASLRLARRALASQDPCAVLREEIARESKRKATKRVRAPRKAEKRLERGARNERMGEIHRQVWERANGRCEAFVGRSLPPGEEERCQYDGAVVDHWEGGIGRRQQKESAASCWLLCGGHNDRRTANWPDADFWNWSREQHCKAHGLPFVPHIVHAPATPRSRHAPGR